MPGIRPHGLDFRVAALAIRRFDGPGADAAAKTAGDDGCKTVLTLGAILRAPIAMLCKLAAQPDPQALPRNFQM